MYNDNVAACEDSEVEKTDLRRNIGQQVGFAQQGYLWHRFCEA